MRARRIAWLFVVAQMALIVAVVVAPGNHWDVPRISRHASWVIVGIAAVLGLWAARWLGRGLTPLPLPNGRVDLVTGGPYRWVRHPMYTAVMLGMGGIAIRSGSWWSCAFAAALVALFAVKARWEERHLVAAFPGYQEYRERTGRFVPRVG